jgi:hypothetical protein
MHVRCSRIVIAVVVSAACSSATEPTSPEVVPAGVSDPAWAVIGKTCTPSSSVTAVPRARLDSAPPLTHGPVRTVDDEWADIARQVPGGFAGIILENGTPVIFLVDTTQRQQAFAGLQGRLSVPGGFAAAKVRAARWNFAELADWYRYLLVQPLWAQISSADIDEAKNRISFGAPDSTSRAKIEQSLAKLDLPCYLVAIEQRGFVIVTDSRPD